MVSRRTSLWVPFVTSTAVFDSLAAGLEVHIDLASISESDMGLELSQYTTRRVLFTLIVEEQATDFVLATGIVYRQEGVAATSPPNAATNPTANWQYHEYHALSSTQSEPLRVVRELPQTP